MKTPEELAEKYCTDNFGNFAIKYHGNTEFELHPCMKAFLAGYAAAHDWISVEEELPVVGQECLVLVNIEGEPPRQFAKRLEDHPKVWFHTNRGIWCGLESITHWLPLPPLPTK